MHIVIDLILISIFLAFAILFLKYGFARTAYRIGKTWLSVFCSMIIGPWVADKIDALFLRKALTNGINSTLTTLVENNANDYNLEQLFDALPQDFVSFLNSFGIDFAALEAEYGQSTYASREIIFAISEKIADPCIQMISSIIGHIICFVVPLIVFIYLNIQIRKRKVPFFRYVDHAFGLLVGLTIGYCLALATAMIISMVFQIVVCFNAESAVTSIYQKSYVLKFLNEFNTLGFIKSNINNLVTAIK